jgi:PKD repeat protein
MKTNSFILLILSLTIILTGCRKLPLAKFEVVSLNVNVGESIAFDNKTFNAKSYLWDFGDGTTSTERDPIHTYESEGTYTVNLRAYSKKGNNSSAANKVINVTKSQAQIDAEASSLLIVNTWSLDSLNLDENNGPFHMSTPVANLWGGTTEYLYIFTANPNSLVSSRDGVQESTDTWAFNSGTELEISNQVILNVENLTATKFVYSKLSAQDPNYTETWFFTKQ